MELKCFCPSHNLINLQRIYYNEKRIAGSNLHTLLDKLDYCTSQISKTAVVNIYKTFLKWRILKSMNCSRYLVPLYSNGKLSVSSAKMSLYHMASPLLDHTIFSHVLPSVAMIEALIPM